MPKAFVTGASGFVGSHLVDALLAKGYRVSCLVRKTSNLKWLEGKNVELVYSYIGDKSGALEDGLKDTDICFHAAGIIHAPNKKEYTKVNVDGTRWMAEACAKATPNIKRFVLVSSIAAGGPARTNGGLAYEGMKEHPISGYGASKLAGEKVIKEYKNKFPIAIVRPPAICGPRDHQLLKLFNLAKKGFFLLPGGKGRRVNISYVSDIVQGILLAAEEEKAVGQTYYVGYDRNYYWEEVADCLSMAVGEKVVKVSVPEFIVHLAGLAGEIRYLTTKKWPKINLERARIFSQRNWTIDVRKIKSELGYKPKYSLAKGFGETIAWYRKEGWIK